MIKLDIDPCIFSYARCFTPKKVHYSIQAASKAMNKPCSYVISLLKRNRQYLKNGYSTPLSPEMLYVLEDDYVKNLHQFFNSANSGIITDKKQYNHFLSFRKLFKHESYRYLDYAQEWAQIDEALIRQSFIEAVKRHSQHSMSDGFNDRILTSFVVPHPACGKTTLAKTLFSIISFENERVEPQGLCDFIFSESRYIVFKDYFNCIKVLCGCTEPHSALSYCLTPLTTQGTSSGGLVRQIFLPHRYRVYGTSDDDPDHAISNSEFDYRFTNCSNGVSSCHATRA